MTIMKYNPSRSLGGLTRRMNSIFNTFEPSFAFETGDFLPRVDISETEKQLQIQAEIPGLTKDDFKLTVNDNNVLVLKGSKKRESEEQKNENGITYQRIERTCGEFTRSFVLPDNVNPESIAAKFENGVLNIAFDKIEPQKPKEIEISVN